MKHKILLIEDDETSVFILKRLECFAKLGFEITKVVANGKEGLKVSEEESFDLILADINMPIINGLEFATVLRERKDHTRLIFISTHESFTYAKKAIQVGALDYLTKPIDEIELIKLLEQVKQEVEKQEHELNAPEQTKIREIYELLLHQKAGVEVIIGRINLELEKQDTEAVLKKELQQVISMLWRMLCQDFGWITNFKNFKIEFYGEDIWLEAQLYLQNIEEIIKSFQLDKYDAVVNNICQIVVGHIDTKNLFDLVSEEVQLSKDHIGKIIKRKLNMTFNEYITFIKMEYAKSLIIDSSLKVYEISERLGYESTDYFTKLFKQNTGMTPIKFKGQYVTNDGII